MFKKYNLKVNHKKLILVSTLFLILILSFSVNVQCAHIHEEDPKDDVWKITLLDFLYIVGDEFPDRPESISDVEDLLDKMVVRSEQVDDPDSIDIEEIYINTDDPTYTAVIIEMEDDIKDSDFVEVIVILEDSHGDWIELQMEWDEASGEDYEWTSEDWEGNDTVGGISEEQIGIAFPKSECDYEEGDDYIVLAFTYSGNFPDPLQSVVYYDFSPNSAVTATEEGLYQGEDIITGYISQFAQFLFGWFMIGYLPFLFLIALLIAGFQILMDRKNKYLHMIGLIFLILMLYPIFMYSLAIDLTPMNLVVLIIPNVYALLALFSLMCFGIFILLSLLNNFGVLRKYRYAFLSGMILMDTIETIYVILYSSTEHTITLFILIVCTIGLYATLILSKMYGRNETLKHKKFKK